MSTLRYSITKIVPQERERCYLPEQPLAEFYFREAYAELRRACPRGNLRIHLSIDELGADTASTGDVEPGPRAEGRSTSLNQPGAS